MIKVAVLYDSYSTAKYNKIRYGMRNGVPEEKASQHSVLQRFASWLSQNLRRKSAHALTFGGDFELKFRACTNSRRKICDNQPANLCIRPQVVVHWGIIWRNGLH